MKQCTEMEFWKKRERLFQLLQAAFNGWQFAFDRDDLIAQEKWKRLRIKLERKYCSADKQWRNAAANITSKDFG